MAYSRLLRAYYRRERPITDADKYRLCRALSRGQKAAIDAVLTEFFELAEDGWHNKRADEEIAAYQAQADTNRRIAKGRQRQRTVNEPYHESCNEPSNESKSKRIPNQEPEARERSKEAAAPLRDPVWNDGLDVLKAAGVSHETARTFIGKLLKDWPADTVADALAESRGTADPKGYASKLLQAKPKKNGRGDDYTAGAV